MATWHDSEINLSRNSTLEYSIGEARAYVACSDDHILGLVPLVDQESVKKDAQVRFNVAVLEHHRVAAHPHLRQALL